MRLLLRAFAVGTRAIRLCAAGACAILLLVVGERSLGLPSLPGLPSVPSANQAAKGVASNELLKQFGDWFNLNRPVYVSGNDVLPTIANLPGGAFHPASFAVTRKLFAGAPGGVIHLPPGDYNVTVVTYCMGHQNQGPWRNKFLLAPIKGAWSDIVVALNYRAAGSRFTPPQIQVLSWSLQAGMDYQEMSAQSQQVIDGLLPEYKSRLAGDFYDRARDEWNSLSSKVPGAPDFNAALGQMGPIGTTLTQLNQAREQIIADGNDFNAMVAQFGRLGSARVLNPIPFTPWSVIAPGVYARLRTKGTLLTQGVVQIRVTAQAASSHGFDVASTHLDGLGVKRVAFDWFPFPFTNWAGFLNGPTQPLSWTPMPNDPPDPNQSDGGPDNGNGGGGWQFFGSTWHRSSGGSGNNAGNNGNNNNNDQDTGGGPGGGNGGSNSNGSSDENNGNDFDTSTPCDPPGNVFGIPKGTVIASGGTSLVLGPGKDPKTGRVLCLLLRPFVSMAAIGFPTRGTGSVDDGSVGYNLPGQSGPGKFVVIAHYTYATTSTITQPYIKEQVTAVIEYANVAAPCPELSQTLQSHTVLQLGSPTTSGWLSGAELENRMCIAGVIGSQVPIQAWVVDGTAVNSLSLNHPVNPENFLYEDAWNHM